VYEKVGTGFSQKTPRPHRDRARVLVQSEQRVLQRIFIHGSGGTCDAAQSKSAIRAAHAAACPDVGNQQKCELKRLANTF
jgi:hypothetical protein